ncbi:hypothetical protein BDZ97DRAFT_1923931 [Flammula alnicola]|nr:hypothetical protein BDZ97DRAFT_1923931 [Flammula alnicola]
MVVYIQPSTFVVESDQNLGHADDRLGLKLLVSALLFLESAHSFTASQTIYYDTVTKWKSAKANSYPLSTTVMIETLITIIVQVLDVFKDLLEITAADKLQSFFSLRIYRLSGRFTISIACFSLAFLRFLGGTVVTAEIYKDVPNNPNGIGYVLQWGWLITASLALGVAADVLIAISMLYYLRKLASPTNLKSTTQIINRLVRWSLQTGLITSVGSITVIISFQAMGNMVWFGLYVILAKLYSNSLLVSLNARPRKRRVQDLENWLSTGMKFEHTPNPISISIQITRPDGTVDQRPPITLRSSENDAV